MLSGDPLRGSHPPPLTGGKCSCLLFRGSGAPGRSSEDEGPKGGDPPEGADSVGLGSPTLRVVGAPTWSLVVMT